jgi:ABC-type transporter Mla subunit MlaD
MTDQVFRIIIAVAVGLACIMAIVQAFVIIGVYNSVRKLERRLAPLADRFEPVIENINGITARIGPLVDDASPTLEKVGPMVDKITLAFDKVGPLVEKVGIAVDQAGKILANANRIVEDTRPRISEVSTEVAAISHSGREQVERLGELLQDAGERARTRLEQIDHSVENTVEQVEQVGDAMIRSVMRPVREVNGIAAGISAAVATLVKKPRKYSVDSATQDEEMFI